MFIFILGRCFAFYIKRRILSFIAEKKKMGSSFRFFNVDTLLGELGITLDLPVKVCATYAPRLKGTGCQFLKIINQMYLTRIKNATMLL